MTRKTLSKPRSSTLAGIGCAILCSWLAALPRGVAAADPGLGKPFFNARQQQADYAGPGRELPAPPEIEEVLIGYFGPDDPDDPQFGGLWRAARAAVEEANRGGGYRGKPFRLVAGWSENPWGTGVAQVTRMAYRDRVWAIIGGVDGPSTHLAEQVVAKARLVLISPVSTDKTVNLANVPWMFSLLPGDHLQAPVLVGAIADRSKEEPVVLVSTDEHDSHLFAAEIQKHLARRRIVLRYHYQCKRGAADAEEIAGRIVQSDARAAVVAGTADDSTRLATALRARGFQGTIFGGPQMGRRQFAEKAGAAAEGVVFPLLYDPQRSSPGLAETLKHRFGVAPDYAAVHTYDAVRMVVAAIRTAGLNRARIRDAVRDLSPWTGVAGPVRWDGLGSNTRSVELGTIRNGRVWPKNCDEAESVATGQAPASSSR